MSRLVSFAWTVPPEPEFVKRFVSETSELDMRNSVAMVLCLLLRSTGGENRPHNCFHKRNAAARLSCEAANSVTRGMLIRD